MRKLFTLISLFLYVVASSIQAQPTDSYLLGKMSQGRISGASSVVIKDGKWIYSSNLGKANLATDKAPDQQTIYMLASVSKTMTATAIMQLRERNLLDLDVDINRYLPFPVRTPGFANDSITARMLLTHTSAIQDDWNTLGALYVYGDSPISLNAFLKGYLVPGGTYYNATNFYSYRPGAQYNYSNIGATLAAYLVEHITGDAFSHYCDTAIFQKLCMNNTSFLLSGIGDTTSIARPYYWDGSNYEDAGLYGYPDYPDGQLRSTATDMARFMTMYLQYGEYDGSRILDSATVDYMLQQQTPVSADQGLMFYSGTSSNGDKLWGHNGGDVGVNTAMYFNMKKKTGAVVLTNGDGTGAFNADLFVDILYKYGLTVIPDANDTFPSCAGHTISVSDIGEDNPMNVNLYPNPATQTTWLTLDVKESDTPEISMTDIQGRLIQHFYSAKGTDHRKIAIDLQGIDSGIYIIHVVSKSGSRSVKLVVW